MREAEDFFRWVVPYARAVSDPVASRHIIDAARDFCEATRCWREVDEIAVSGEEAEVVCVPPYASLFEIEAASFDGRPLDRVAWLDTDSTGGLPSQITQAQPQSVSIAPRGACGMLSISMFLEPAQDADVLPDFLFEQFGQSIAKGALASLLLLPDQPFTNPGLATLNAQMFGQAKDRNFAHNRRGQQRAPLRTRPQYF